MKKYHKYAYDWASKNSLKRYETIESTLDDAKPNISKETIRSLLSKEIYDGLCNHYYDDYCGTLFSIIYDLTELKADVCFGPPTHNKWFNFPIDYPNGINTYDAILPNKSVKLDRFYNRD